MRSALGYAALPWGLDLLLTDSCNLRCTYCPVATDELAHRTGNFLDTAQGLRFLDSIASFRPMIRLFGGEPFLHPEWRRIVAAAVAKGLPVTAVTNGVNLAGSAEDLVRSGLLALGISIDPPESHDRDRGRGTFTRCKELVAEIAAARSRLGSDTPRLEIYTTVHERSYAALGGWAEQLRRWPIETLRIQHLIWFSSARWDRSAVLLERAMGTSRLFRADVEHYRSDAMPSVDPGRLVSEIRRATAVRASWNLEMHPPLPAEEMGRFYGETDFTRGTERSCALVSRYAFVDPIGRLYPCLTLDMGNVFDDPFESVWNGKKFRAFRRLIRRHQRLPLCERCPA